MMPTCALSFLRKFVKAKQICRYSTSPAISRLRDTIYGQDESPARLQPMLAVRRLRVPLPPWGHGHGLDSVFLFSGAGETLGKRGGDGSTILLKTLSRLHKKRLISWRYGGAVMGCW
jgi:hypothetical protein